MKTSGNAEIMRLLVAVGVATLHEAQGRRGLMTGPRLLVGPAFAGPAFPVAIPAGDNLGVHMALQASAPGSVICVGSRGAGLFGIIGELIVTAARARSIAGLVIDDGIRDVEHLEPPPSIAARSISARGTVKRRTIAFNEPIDVGAVLVRPNDWVVADADGVCVIPADLLEDVLSKAMARTERENAIRAELQHGVTTVAALDLTKLAEEALETL